MCLLLRALSRRFANDWSDEYDTLRPASDLISRLQEEISRWLENPARWTRTPTMMRSARPRSTRSAPPFSPRFMIWPRGGSASATVATGKVPTRCQAVVLACGAPADAMMCGSCSPTEEFSRLFSLTWMGLALASASYLTWRKA